MEAKKGVIIFWIEIKEEGPHIQIIKYQYFLINRK